MCGLCLQRCFKSATNLTLLLLINKTVFLIHASWQTPCSVQLIQQGHRKIFLLFFSLAVEKL